MLRGTRALLHDIRHNGGFPQMVDRSGFEVGRNLAVSPGAVIERNEIAEVLQYSPSGDTVFSRPVLVVPPLSAVFTSSIWRPAEASWSTPRRRGSRCSC